MKLNLGSIQIPIEAATKTFAVLAKRGAGKSYTGAVMAEEFYKAGVPFVVFDPIDVWWGLRLDKNGKDKGLPIVVFGLEHADIPLNRDMGREVAQAVVRENVSCVISTFGMPKAGQRYFMSEFADELLKINDTPRHIFIEEAHEFVPQRVFGAMGAVFNAISNLVVMGRNRGLGVTLINQRAATINKDVLTQLDTLLAFRNVSPQDRKALKEWVEHQSAEGDFEKFMSSLPSLPTGEGWIWSPEFMNKFEKIRIRERETFHPDREKLGETFTMPKLEQADIQGFIERFTSKEEQKETEMEKKEHIVAPRPDLAKRINELESIITQISGDMEGLREEKDQEIDELQNKLNKIRQLAAFEGENGETQSVAINGQVEMWLEKLGDSMPSKILKFLSDKAGLKFTRSQIALATGYAVKGGSFANAISLLSRNNLIVKEDKFYQVNPDLV